MDSLFELAVVIAHETGHRIGAIRQLRWSDVDFPGEVVRWRGEHDKISTEHRTPISAEVTHRNARGVAVSGSGTGGSSRRRPTPSAHARGI